MIKKETGITLIELIIVVAIITLIASIGIPTFRSFQGESELTGTTEEIISLLRLAQSKTLASEGASQWGVYATTTPQQFILFKGGSFLTRDPFYDKTYFLPNNVEIKEINLSGNNQEVVFSRLPAGALITGNIVIGLKSNPLKTKTISIDSFGRINLGIETASADLPSARDSRHIFTEYSRIIAVSTESLILTFTYNTSAVTQSIIIADNLKEGQIYWEGQVDVGGFIQKLKIHTLRLNDLSLGTLFSIHRDRRYNNRVLKIEISGDTSGSLVEYSSDGLTTVKSSIYASQPLWQ